MADRLVRVEAKLSNRFAPVVRARLIERLAAAAEYRVTLIAASAGFGKSVALDQYLRSQRLRPVRYNLGSDHASLLGFARGLAAALATMLPSIAAALPTAYEKASIGSRPGHELARWFAEHLQDVDGTIVIDDFHKASAPEVASFLADLIERSDPRTQWIIATRDALDLPVSSWQSYHAMGTPIDEEDLAFTLDEAVAAAPHLAPGDAQELHGLTGGWPAALWFALQSATRVRDLRKAAAGTREMIFGYLAEQVFRELSEREQTFLLETCLFPSVDVTALGRAGMDDAASVAGRLCKKLAFVSVEPAGSLRYHDLFREFLERELETRGARRFTAVLKETARTLESSGRISEALALHVRLRSFAEILRVLERHGFALIEHGRADGVDAAIRALPEREQFASPTVLAIKARFESTAGRYDRADAWYRMALERAADQLTSAKIGLRFASEILQRNPPEAAAILERALAAAPREIDTGALIRGTLAKAHALLGRHERAADLAQTALDMTATSADDELRASLFHASAIAAFYRGDPRRAEAHARMAVELAEPHGAFDLCSRACTVAYSVAIEYNDNPIQAYSLLSKIGDFGVRSGNREAELHALLGLYAIEAENGNEEQLVNLDRRLVEFSPIYDLRISESLLPARALRAAWHGDFLSAYTLLDGTALSHRTGDRRALRWAEIAVYAGAVGKRSQAIAAIESAQSERRQALAHPRAVRAQILLSLANVIIGRFSLAYQALTSAESEISAAGVRIGAFADAVRCLCLFLEGNCTDVEFRESLNALKRKHYAGLAHIFALLPLPSRSPGSSFALLTPSEVKILRALARGATSKEIATATGRSPLTVDVHVKRIVKKLNCHSRTEAVALALTHGFVRGTA